MSQHDDRLTCDNKDCDALATLECICSRCMRENRSGLPSEAVHACAAHQTEVEAFHERMRGRPTHWCGIAPGTRPV